MHIKRFNKFLKRLVQFRVGAIPRLSLDSAPKINSNFECINIEFSTCTHKFNYLFFTYNAVLNTGFLIQIK